MKRLLKDYSLSFTLAALWLLFWAIQTWAGWKEFSAEQADHQQVARLGEYFWVWTRTTFENNQSEMLQLLAFTMLSAYLMHKGSPQSRDGQDEQGSMLQDALQRLERLERKVDLKTVWMVDAVPDEPKDRA